MMHSITDIKKGLMDRARQTNIMALVPLNCGRDITSEDVDSMPTYYAAPHLAIHCTV